MFANYVMAGVRNALRNRMHLIVNILGLTIGLTGFIFTQIFVEYENTHDTFFQNAERIYGIHTRVAPDAGIGVSSTLGVQNALAPLMKANIGEIEEIARFDAREMVIGQGVDILYRQMQFVDPDFFNIFDLDFLVGDASLMDQPGSTILSRSMAQTIFGTDDVVGKTLIVNTDHVVRVVGVFHDLPLNSHFMFNLIGDKGFDIVSNIETLKNINDIQDYDTWTNLSGNYKTYVMFPEGTDLVSVTAEINRLTYENAPDFYRGFFTEIGIRPLPDMNNYIWEAASFPMLPALQILGIVLLVIAVLNYTNLAGAKALLRSREVGMRKVMGASKRSLVLQFVLEAMMEALVALILAVIAISIVVPMFNDAAGKALQFDAMGDVTTMIWLIGTALGAGAVAGLYPAYVLSGLKTISALNGVASSGRVGRVVSGIMVGLQFSLSITLVVTATIVYAQDRYMSNRDLGFNDENVLLIERIGEPVVQAVADQLKAELERIDGVHAVARAVWAPYEGSNNSGFYRTDDSGVEAQVRLNRYGIDDDFLGFYDIPIIVGRNLSRDIANDVQLDVIATFEDDANDDIVREANVLLSRLAVTQMGFASPEAAIGQNLFSYREEDRLVSVNTIVGVTEDFNYMAFQNDVKPLVFHFTPEFFNTINIKYDPRKLQTVLGEVDRVWQEIVPTRPIERQFIEEKIANFESIFQGVTLGIVAFSVLSTLVACIGLFALAAFLAERRTKEIGIRKVMGASIPDIMGRLTLRLALPAAFACLIGLPAGWFIAEMFNEFMADRVPLSWTFFAGPALLIILIACATVAIHTLRVSMAHPIKALRYE